MRICIVGTGYVGLTTGACLAEIGHVVTCVDKDQHKIQKLITSLEAPFYEPGLNELIKQVATMRSSADLKESEYQLNFSDSLAIAREEHFDAYFICVGTPDARGELDISQVLNAAEEIRRNHRSGRLAAVVVKSTVPPGTCKKVDEIVGYDGDLHVASNPEFLKEGHAIEDFRRPDRIVVGYESEHALDVLREVYSHFIRNGHKFMEMNLVSAEMVKYAANAMLAVRISFINEMAAICEQIGADVMEVRKGIGADSRIGPAFLYPGLGFGGSCFPKDLQGIIRLADTCMSGLGVKPNRITRAAQDVQERTIQIFIDKIACALEGTPDPVVAVWGLSYKPKTSDTRNAPAFKLIEDFNARKYKVQAYDPVVRYAHGTVSCDNKYKAVEGADALVLCTEWAEFRKPDWEQVKNLMNPRAGFIVVDGRNQWDLEEMDGLGFRHLTFGRRELPWEK